MKIVEFIQSDYEIHSRDKLDKILIELCDLMIKDQKIDPKKYGMVASCVLDPDNNKILCVNEDAGDGTRRHAERVAIDSYVEKYGEIPEGSIIITTLSPCNEDDTEMAAGRYGESCTDLINNSNVRKVYCGYKDPTQDNDHEKYTLEETSNSGIKNLCKKFADTFLKDELHESAAWQKSSGKNKNGGLNKKGVASYRREHPGSHLQTAVTTKPSKLKKGSKASKRRASFCARMKGMKKSRTSAKTAHDPDSRINKSLRKWHCESIEEMQELIMLGENYINNLKENFADGKNPGRKGLAKRSGVNTKASVSSLRNTAKHSSGEKARMAHWLANMKAGKKKAAK
jgi:pyrimidine deaminase RibD-like protein